MMRRFRLVSLVARGLKWERERLLGFLGIALFGGALLTGCGDMCHPNPRLERLFPLFITKSDLPVGWYRVGGDISRRDRENEGVIARQVKFAGVPEEEFPSVLVSQELIDYPDLGQAARAYAEIVEEEFPVEKWTWPEQIQFESKADQFRLACVERRIDIHGEVDERFRGSYFCRAVGRYGSIISVLHANVFKDQWLTFDDLKRLLEAADTRLASLDVDA
jgi:hypothetical protein